MLVDLVMLQAASAAFAGTLLLALSSRQGAPLVVGTALLCWALLCSLFLVVSWRIGIRSRRERILMLEAAHEQGIVAPND